ncbi:MAG: pilus assembly protein PilM [Syntrophales bacterium LBB04]|nr:pilus assembly protein PilM [Syntrophales bacterium LBB04]
MKEKIDIISSTEKLLDVIRGKGQKSQARLTLPTERTPFLKRCAAIYRKAKAKSKAINVGIDIGHKKIIMVKVTKSAHKIEVLESQTMPIPAGMDKGSEDFRAFLRSTIPTFCGETGENGVWAIMSSARVEVRPIRIPKVSGKHLDTTVYWTLKKEAAFNEKESFFDYEVRGEVSESGNKKLDVLCYTAPIDDVEGIKQLYSGIGVKLSGTSIVPFAVQNLFINNVMPSAEKQTASLFIGNEYSRIDLYIEGKLTLTRDIKTGINSILEMMVETLDITTLEGEHLTHEEARRVLFAFAESEDKPVLLSDGSPVDRQAVAVLISTVLERFVRQMERTIEYITSTFGFDRIGKIYISSVMPVYKALLDYFSEQLDIKCEIFDPLRQSLPDTVFEKRDSFVPAFGIALSDNAYTPNFIYTYKEKNKAAYVVKVNRAVLSGLMMSLLACSAVLAFEWRDVSRAKVKLAEIERQVQQNSPLMNRETLLKAASVMRQKEQKYVELSKRYRAMAIIAELSALTPEAVGLTAIRTVAPEKTPGDKTSSNLLQKAGNDNTTGGVVNSATPLVLEGVISSREDMAETILASYIMKLRSSPMISGVNDVSTNKTTSAEHGALLTFAVEVKPGSGK